MPWEPFPFAALGDPQLAQKAILIAGPPLAAILMYRATIRLSVRPGPAVVAAAAYGLGALTFWAFSEGRLGLLIALAVLPAAAERIEAAFASRGAAGRQTALRRRIRRHVRGRHRVVSGDPARDRGPGRDPRALRSCPQPRCSS